MTEGDYDITENLLVEDFIELTCGDLEHPTAKNILLSADWQLDLAYEIYSDMAVTDNMHITAAVSTSCGNLPSSTASVHSSSTFISSSERNEELVVPADAVSTPRNEYLSTLQLQFETCFQSSFSHVTKTGSEACSLNLELISPSTIQSTTPSTKVSSLGKCYCCDKKNSWGHYHKGTHGSIVRFVREIPLHQRQQNIFTYTSVGSGLLALDLHNISAILTELPVQISRLQIVIVDRVYRKLCGLVRQFLEEVGTTDDTSARSIVEKLFGVVRNMQDIALGEAEENGLMDSCELYGRCDRKSSCATYDDQALVACLEFIASVWTQSIIIKDCIDRTSSTNLSTIEIVIATDLFKLESDLYKADTFSFQF